MGVVCSQDAGEVCEVLQVQSDGCVEAVGRFVSVGEVVA